MTKQMAVISDIQIDLRDKSNTQRVQLLQQCFKHMNVDILVVCGDITENARTDEFDCFFDVYKNNCHAKHLCLIPGNMDNTELPEGKKQFLDVYHKHSEQMKDTTYFFHETDHCILIGLSPEEDNDDEPLSEHQISLLDEYIRKAAKKSLPAFVFCHYIMEDTITTNWKYATLGIQSHQVKEIFEKYQGKVICFSGHIHRGLIKDVGGSMITQNNVTYISTPSLCFPDKINYKANNDDLGSGYLVELCKDSIQVTGHDFLNDKPLNDFKWNI